MTVYFLIFLICILTIVVIILAIKLSRNNPDELLHQKIDTLKDDINRNLTQTNTQLFDTQKHITEQLVSLYQEIGSINKEAEEILSLTQSLSGILRPTKKRGVAGENILEQLIKDIIPKEMVVSQHTFRNGKKVDFLIKLPTASIPIDAKFSLDTFQNYLEAKDQDKEKLRRILLDSIKRRIDESSLYILPDEGTFDFALMYVPSEALYYFLITETNILDYAHKKRVFVVGPNNFYVYLQTLFIGIEALKIEKKSKIVYDYIKRMANDIENVLKEYNVLGTHIKDSSAKFEDIRKKLETFRIRINSFAEDDNPGKSNHPC